jgi:CRP-like cAMP-binding protein
VAFFDQSRLYPQFVGNSLILMTMNIAEYATSIVKLSPTLEQEIGRLLKKEELPKKRLLHDEGQICQRIYFVEKGLVRAFYYKDDGKDITDWFAPENSFITAVDSFFQQKPSRYFLELLEDSVLYSLTYTELESLYNTDPQLERLGRLILLEVFEKSVNRTIALQFQTAQERYQSFAQTYPTLLQRAPLGHIASFLGITQETLSRVRARK